MVNVGHSPDGSVSSTPNPCVPCSVVICCSESDNLDRLHARPRSNPVVIDRNIIAEADTSVASERPSSTPPNNVFLSHSIIHQVEAPTRSNDVTQGPLNQCYDAAPFCDSVFSPNSNPEKESVQVLSITSSSHADALVVDTELPVVPNVPVIGDCSDDSLPFPTSPLTPLPIKEKPTSLRTGLKRPHSATSGFLISEASDETNKRPCSAPKRLVEETFDTISELFFEGSTLSFNTTESATIVATDSDANTVYPPKSTLEALVASNSPLLFFPTGYSLDADQDVAPLSDFLSTSPVKSRPSPTDSYGACDSQSNNPDFLIEDTGSDILNGNSANSVSSSRSLASVDLGETNTKESDFQSSPNPTLGELEVPSRTCLEVSDSITTHLSSFVEAMRSYAAELCPVDCVILMERCRPFNCDTLFMKYFREQYLGPILSNLNGGPPLNADFGRDAYTSLYSLHGFYWRKPKSMSTWVPDTPIIYRILKQMATVKHEERHITNERNDMLVGTPGRELLEAVVEAFDGIDRARRGLCKQVQRHLILLTVSPINLMELHKEISSSCKDGLSSGPLADLRSRGVALSTFSPIASTTLLQLYEMVNGTPPSPLCDRYWQTVALSPKLINSDSPERRIIGPLAAEANAQTEAELILTEQRPKRFAQDHSSVDSALSNGHNNLASKTHYETSPSSPARYASKSQRQPSQTSGSYVEGHTNGKPSNMNTAASGAVAENAYRVTPNKSTPASTPTNHPLSPLVQQGPPNESSVSHGLRISRAPGHTHGSTPPSRSCNTRHIPDGSRPPEVPISCSSLSAGHSGPNSVDQAGPGSAYGSDSVATPQGFSAGILSPQQAFNSGSTVPNHIYSPVSNSVTNHTGSFPPQQPYQQLPVETSISQQYYRSSPISGQTTFRPPSNAASPAAQYANFVNSAGLPSPSSTRGSTRQYSPQLPPHQVQLQQSGNHSQRHVSPHSGGSTLCVSQSARSHQMASPVTDVMPTNRSRSSTPTNFPPGISPSQVMPNSYQLKDSVSNPPCPGSSGAWMHGHLQMQPTTGGPGRPYDALPHRPGVPTSSPYPPTNQQGLVASARSSGPGGMARLDPNPHQISQPMRRQQGSPLDMPSQCPPGRSILWEGEVHMPDSNITGPSLSRLKMSLILEQAAVRDLIHLNMQLWGPVAQLSVILVHCDSALVHRLTNNSPGSNVLGQVLVDLPQSEEAFNLVSALSSSVSSVAVPLGILSPPSSSLPNPIPPGTISFICLSYSVKRNHVYGLIPADSEQFRQDLSSSRYQAFPTSGIGGQLEAPGPVQRPHPSSVPRPCMMSDDPYVLRSTHPSSFTTPNSGSTYASAQRPMVTTGDRCNPNAPGYLNQTHMHYQSSATNSQLPSSTPYLSNSGLCGAKGQGSFGPMQQHPQMALQRTTPSPPLRQREMMIGQPGTDPQPPPQWIGSQVDIPPHVQGRVGKPGAQQSYPQRPQLHAKPSHPYMAQPRRQIHPDQFLQGSTLMPQNPMMNEAGVVIEHPLRRNSPQYIVSSQQPQQRFLAGGAGNFQPNTMVQQGYPISGSSSAAAGYGGISCNQRPPFQGQSTPFPSVNMGSNTTTGYSHPGPGSYASRGGPVIPQQSGSASFRFAGDPSLNGSNNIVNTGFMQVHDSKSQHQLHHLPAMDGQSYQTRSLNCSVMPTDNTMGSGFPHTAQQQGSHFVAMPPQDPMTQPPQPSVQGSSMYGSMHPQQHSTYDAFGPSGFF